MATCDDQATSYHKKFKAPICSMEEAYSHSLVTEMLTSGFVTKSLLKFL